MGLNAIIASSDSQEIAVDHFYELTRRDSQGHRLLVAQGLDGIQYWLVECKVLSSWCLAAGAVKNRLVSSKSSGYILLAIRKAAT